MVVAGQHMQLGHDRGMGIHIKPFMFYSCTQAGINHLNLGRRVAVGCRLKWWLIEAGGPVDFEKRIIELEIKLISQDDLTQQLSDLIYSQQKQIDELRALCTALVKRLGETSDDGGVDTYAQEKPPHY